MGAVGVLPRDDKPRKESRSARWAVYLLVAAAHVGVFFLVSTLNTTRPKPPPSRDVTFVDIQTLTPPPPKPTLPPPPPTQQPVPQPTTAPVPEPAQRQPVATAPVEPSYVPQYQIDEVPVLPDSRIQSQTVYPPMAARQGIQAVVFLELYIDETGRIRKIDVLRDPGYGFAEAAVKALDGVVCQPARIQGKPVAVKFRYAVRFQLK